MRFVRISYTPQLRVRIAWADTPEMGALVAEYGCTDPPAAEFLEALGLFRSFVQRILEVTDEWMETVTISGVSMSESDAGREIVVVYQPALARPTGPFYFTTPHVRVEDHQLELPVMLIERAASRYLAGVRARSTADVDGST